MHPIRERTQRMHESVGWSVIRRHRNFCVRQRSQAALFFGACGSDMLNDPEISNNCVADIRYPVELQDLGVQPLIWTHIPHSHSAKKP